MRFSRPVAVTSPWYLMVVSRDHKLILVWMSFRARDLTYKWLSDAGRYAGCQLSFYKSYIYCFIIHSKLTNGDRK